MPLTGPVAALQSAQRSFAQMGQANSPPHVAMLEDVKKQGLTLLKQEFATSTSALGDPFQQTVRHKPALLSRKLAYAFGGRVDQDSIRWVGRVGRDWLDVMQTGWTFKARNGGGQSLFFDKNNRLLKLGKLSGRQIKKVDFVREVKARDHKVGERKLPARPMVPPNTSGDLPRPWDSAVKAGLSIGFKRWSERVI